METIDTLGKYELKRPLGRGAMGMVYEGWDPIIARRVAIKTVKLPDDASEPEMQEGLARFRREAQAAGRLNHPNIVGVFDYGETHELAYIVMEYVDGPSLKSLLDKQERFVLADTVHIMEDLLAGLQFSHERGVVHRDIKPANLMLTSSGQVKIADFGIARIESSSITQAGTVLGTPAYMSPEQFMGQVVDPRTDIYSAGVLLYQLLTGERPFEGGMSAIMHKALHTEPPAPSELSVTAPASFDGVVRRAMAKRPEDRFATASSFAEAIRKAMAEPATPAVEAEATLVAAPPPKAAPAVASVSQPMAPVIPPKRRSSMPVLVGAGVAVLVVAGGGARWLLQRLPPAPPAPATSVAANAPAAGTQTAPPPAPVANAPVANTPVANTPVANTTPPSPAPLPSGQSDAPAAVPSPTPAPVISTATALPQEPPKPSAPPPPTETSKPATTVAPAPQSLTPPPQPNEQQVAVANPGILRGQIAQWLNGRSCTLLGGAVGDNGSVVLHGLAGGNVENLRQDFAALVAPDQVDWQVSGVDHVFCPALNALHPLAPAFGAVQGTHLALQMANGKTRLHDGEPIGVSIVMPDFASRLVVDYIAHDGTVQHLYPQLAQPGNGIRADPPRSYGANEPVNLSNAAWLIGPPYGTDMIIAVASSAPLFDHPRPSNAEQAEVYVHELQAAIDRGRQRGVRLSGAAVTLDALPKQ